MKKRECTKVANGTRKIIKPKIGKNLKLGDLESLTKEEWIEDYYFQNQEVNDLSFYYTEISSCTFENMILRGNFEKVDLLDIIFDHCDLSNLNFNGRSIHRVIFKHCKLVGTNFMECSLENIIFEECNLSYSNFSNARIKDLEFLSCNLNEASLNELAWNHLVFEQCTLDRTEFLHTSLNQIDFTTCDIEGVLLEPSFIKGLIVTSYQAILLSRLFGIIIQDEK